MKVKTFVTDVPDITDYNNLDAIEKQDEEIGNFILNHTEGTVDLRTNFVPGLDKFGRTLIIRTLLYSPSVL